MASDQSRASFRDRGPQTEKLRQQLDEAVATWPEKLASLRVEEEKLVAAAVASARQTLNEGLLDSKRKRDAAEQLWNKRQLERAAYLQKPSRLAALDARITSKRNELAVVSLERKNVIADLKAGMFCSKCGASKYELEHDGDGQDFQQHLAAVNGRPILMPEKVQARDQQFAARIAQLSGQLGSLQAQLANAKVQESAWASQFEQHRAQYQSLQAELGAGDADSKRIFAEVEQASKSSMKMKADQRVSAAQTTHDLSVENLREQIAKKEREHDKELDRLLAERRSFEAFENLLSEQLSARALYDMKLSDREMSVLKRIDGIMNGTYLPETLADAEIAKQQEDLEVAKNLRETVYGLDSDMSDGRALGESIRRLVGLIEPSPAEELIKRMEAEYRERLIRKNRIILGLETAPAGCTTNPLTCLENPPPTPEPDIPMRAPD